MSNKVLKQLQSETDSWLRIIQFLKAENANLKNRLADLLQIQLESEDLPRVEHFQNCFIDEDELLSWFALNIKKHSKIVDSLVYENGNKKYEAIINDQKRIREEIEFIIMNFVKVNSDFNNYLADKIYLA